MQHLDTISDDALAAVTGGIDFQAAAVTHGSAPMDPSVLPGDERHSYPHFTPEYFQRPITSGSTPAPAALNHPVR